MNYNKMTLQELVSCEKELKRLIADLENRIRINGNSTGTEKRMLQEYHDRHGVVTWLILRKSPIS